MVLVGGLPSKLSSITAIQIGNIDLKRNPRQLTRNDDHFVTLEHQKIS